MIIDPLEAVVTWLKTQLTSIEGRVVGKHRYGKGWSEAQTGMSVHLDGGLPDLYAALAIPRLEIRIYADDQAKIVTVWRELIGLSRQNERFEVSTSQGIALIHYFIPKTSLSLIYDERLNKDLGVIFMESMISEESVQ